jgi:hypothetical protein
MRKKKHDSNGNNEEPSRQRIHNFNRHWNEIVENNDKHVDVTCRNSVEDKVSYFLTFGGGNATDWNANAMYRPILESESTSAALRNNINNQLPFSLFAL